jgi:hypothetical protein
MNRKDYEEQQQLERIGRNEKSINPAYQDWTDLEVGHAIAIYKPEKIIPKEKNMIARVEDLQNYYLTNRGAISSWWQRLKSEGRTKFQQALNEEQAIVLEMAAAYEKAWIDGQISQAQFEKFITEHSFALLKIKAEATLLMEATAQGYTHENWQQVKRERELSDQRQNTAEYERNNRIIEQQQTHEHRIDEQNIEARNQMLTAQNDAGIKEREMMLQHKHMLKEYKVKERLRFEHQIEEWRERVRLGIISKHLFHHQQGVLLQELINNAYLEIDKIKRNPNLLEETKKAMCEDYMGLINNFRRDRDRLQLNE